ncbi:hypothetical protein NMG60_11005942 [Bertholletia excelsa]
MEKQERKLEKEEKQGKHEDLPIKSSPYTQYEDLEEYKRQAYGTEGHLEPKPGRGAGATDAPTISGDASAEVKLFPTDVIGGERRS